MVNQLLKQFKQMRKVMRKVSKGDVGALMESMPPGLDGLGGPPPRGVRRKRKTRKSKRKRK